MNFLGEKFAHDLDPTQGQIIMHGFIWDKIAMYSQAKTHVLTVSILIYFPCDYMIEGLGTIVRLNLIIHVHDLKMSYVFTIFPKY